MLVRTAALMLTLILASPAWCDGFSKFYQPNPNAPATELSTLRVSAAPSIPELVKVQGNPEETVRRYYRKGYVVIGVSSFESGWRAKESGALKLGRKVEADLVIFAEPQLVSSQTSSIPLTTPTTQTTYHTGTATAYGSGGTVTAYGTGTSTTHGTQTTYIPFTVNRFSYGALYLVKMKSRTGMRTRPTNDSERRQLQTNAGRVVTDIIDDSPAFFADILPGDFLLKINGQPIPSDSEYLKLLDSLAGQTAILSINRNGVELSKSIQFLSY